MSQPMNQPPQPFPAAPQGPLTSPDGKAQWDPASGQWVPIKKKRTGLKVTGGVIVGVFALVGLVNVFGGGETTSATAPSSAEQQVGTKVAGANTRNGSAKAGSAKKNEPEQQASMSEQQAIQSAENYLDFQGFSKSGLIKQLEFEEFSTADAKYAANHVDVDWKEQAVRAAENYLDVTSFSQSGLVEQLEFDGFTNGQAQHGAEVAFGRG